MRDKIRSFIQRAFGPLKYIRNLQGETRRYRRRLIIIGLLGVAVYAQSLITPQITRQIIDVAYPARDFMLFYILSAIMVGLNVIASVLGAVNGYLTTYTNNLIAFRIRMRVFHALHRVPVSYVESHQSGMFLERIAADADRTAGSLAGILPQIISLLLTAVLTVGMMANISLLVTGLVVAIVPFYYLTNTILSVKLRQWQQETRLKDEQLTTRANEAIQGVPTARLFGVGRWLKTMYTNLLRDKIKIAFGIWRTQLIWGRLSWAVSYGWGVVLTVGGWYLVFQDRLTLGDAVALGMYIPLLLRPAEQALGMYQSLMASSVPAQRVTEVLDEAQNGETKPIRKGFAIRENIRLDNVDFAYPGNRRCLKNISLAMSCGEGLIIVGPTGSGKTTLLRIMAGMFEPGGGRLLADDIPLSNIRLSDYQSDVAMVMADNFFFSGTIMENMLMAGPHLDESEVRRTAGILGLDSWLMSLPSGYDTPLGVGGIRFSSGQTQKVAILRAALKKPRLLLLDEITSSMDVVSERNILDGLKQLRPPENITVMTSHRLTLTLEDWIDRVIVLNDGIITEQGAAHDLYASGGEYRKLMDIAGLGELFANSERVGRVPNE